MRYIYLTKRIRCGTALPLLVYLFFIFAGAEKGAAALLCVAVHEAGHIAAGLALARKVQTVTIDILGADIGYAGTPSYAQDMLAAAAGPAASVVSGLLLCRVWNAFFVFGMIYGLFNLLPLPGFDGGRILKDAVYRKLDIVSADILCSTVNTVFLIALYLFSVFVLFYTSFNASLLLICVYLFAKNFAS